MLIVTNPAFEQCHASTLVELSSGKLLAAWFGGDYEGHANVSIWTSIFSNGHWSKPMIVADGFVGDKRYPTWNPVLFKNTSGILYLFYKVGPNPRSWWGMMKTSEDEGATWSRATRLADGIIGPVKNKPITLDDGTILSPSSTETESAWRIHIERSTDEGKSWQRIPVDTAGGYDVIQPSILRYDDGRLQILCRSKHGSVMQSWSSDRGEHWSKLSATTLKNPNSGTDAVTLRGGRQLIIYNPDLPGKDWWNGRSRLHASISADGLNWTDAFVLEHGSQEEFSYPSVIQTQDGKIHVTYTYDRKNIKYVVLEEI